MKKFMRKLKAKFVTVLVATLILSNVDIIPVQAEESYMTYVTYEGIKPDTLMTMDSETREFVTNWETYHQASVYPDSAIHVPLYVDKNLTTVITESSFVSNNDSDTYVTWYYDYDLLLSLKDDDSLSEEEQAAIYSNIMSSPAAKYYLSCQPHSALILDAQVNITEDMLSPNYDKGVVDLPRLSSSYYYEVSGNTEFYLSSGVYPSLCWTPAAQGSYCTLTIRSEADASSLYSCTITLPNGIDGIDVSDFVDISADLASTLAVNEECYIWGGAIELYPSNVHVDHIVMPSYTIYPTAIVTDLTDEEVAELDAELQADGGYFKRFRIPDVAVKHSREVLSVGGSTNSSDIKEYAQYYQSMYNTKALLFQGSKLEGCTYDNNTGIAVTRTTAADTNPLYYFIATNEKCYWGAVTTEAVSADELTSVDGNAEPMTWLTDTYNSVYELNDDIVSYDDWWSSSYVGGLTMRGKYEFMPSTTASSKNIYAKTLMFAGVDPHLGTLTIKNPPRTTTISYYYMEPNSTSWTKLGDDVVYDSASLTLDDLITLPELEDFQAKGWYTDTSLASKVSLSSLVSTSSDINIRLYSGYDYTGGTYTVTFYNDVTGSKNVATFEKRELPTLPANPNPQAGYAFRCWKIVSEYDSVNGTDYNPETFVPEADKDYKFKTSWDIKGIITKVLTDKTKYYIGETVDKSLLEVYVQTDNDGTLRVLEDNEYTMSGNTITKTGPNQFTITYTATGATGLCEVTGMEDVPLGISAVYTGGDITVGSELKSTMFLVTQHYLSGKTATIETFSFSPNTVKLIGDNEVTITTATKSCTVNVVGLAATAAKDAVMQKITATFVGANPTVGDAVNPAHFNVTAEYSDNTKRTLPSTEFTISPATYTSSGTFYVRIECNGLVANPSVSVKSPTVTPVPTPTPSTPTPSTPSPSKPSQNTNTSNSKPNTSGSSTNFKPSVSTSNKNDTSNNSNSTNTTEKKESTASPLYISGATIMTKNFGESNATPKENQVDILELIENTSKDADSVTVKLINGRTNNDITPTMFKKLREKKLVLYVEMYDADNTSTLVARWSVNTAAMESDTASLNPNIFFETVNKESDKVVKIDITTSNYPKGTTLNVYPSLRAYGSGQTVRLYEITGQGQVNVLKSTFTWLDTSNKIPVDVYTCYHYALSDATTSYNISDNLLEEIVPIIEETPEEDNEESEDGIYIGGSPDEDWEWDYPETPPIDPEDNKFPWLLIILIGGGILVIGIVIVIIVCVSSKKTPKTSKGVTYMDTSGLSENGGPYPVDDMFDSDDDVEYDDDTE